MLLGSSALPSITAGVPSKPGKGFQSLSPCPGDCVTPQDTASEVAQIVPLDKGPPASGLDTVGKRTLLAPDAWMQKYMDMIISLQKCEEENNFGITFTPRVTHMSTQVLLQRHPLIEKINCSLTDFNLVTITRKGSEGALPKPTKGAHLQDLIPFNCKV
ncbi:hypothetical protein DUI87_09904 [Hirundo rustica rustica]|uniref:Uncharacterized protein n=1 Tax=Hirundo rustica rustica TaxID=333673 RepID=A0A3M0KGM1_HIRRU|nr:hypothetical protein DUI87_09904 [Hirundo rustica rustica]